MGYYEIMNYKRGDIVDIKISMKDFIKEEINKNPQNCVICHCNPKPDEWSTIEGICFDCG